MNVDVQTILVSTLAYFFDFTCPDWLFAGVMSSHVKKDNNSRQLTSESGQVLEHIGRNQLAWH
jgi:hypothetical protein